MQIREYSEADLSRVKELHARSGFGYELPDLSDPSVFSRRIVFDQTGIGMAAFLRLSAESFLVCDPQWRNPGWRELALRQLEHICRKDAFEKGVKDVNCFLPPGIEKKFGRRLLHRGWRRYGKDEWKCYSIEV